jgi:hypothetical protein
MPDATSRAVRRLRPLVAFADIPPGFPLLVEPSKLPQKVAARLAVAWIDILNQTNHLSGTLAPRNQEVRHALTIAARNYLRTAHSDSSSSLLPKCEVS